MTARPERARSFTYGALEIDEDLGVVRCHYRLDDRAFVEVVHVGPGRAWTDAAREAARLVHLLAGVSYYKVGAAHAVDLADVPVRPAELDLLRAFYLEGLGEFAHRNDLRLDDVAFTGGREAGPAPAAAVDQARPLVPFGGGIDSLVSVDIVRRAHEDVALFVTNRRGDPFEAIETAARATGLPMLRVQLALDPQLLRPADPGAVFNGHVPITGVLSALAVLVAVLDGRGLVVMSNEWSASRGNLVVDGREVNHQWSKGDRFEDAFRRVLAGALGPDLQWFSLLRSFSELWVAERFASLPQFHGVVHSCNRAFHLDASQRLQRWCGRCDKCCFIDLILAPFLPATDLARLFDGAEPLADLTLLPTFRALLGIGDARKPFECVGDVDECRTAAALAQQRADRAGDRVLRTLLAELGPDASTAALAGAERLRAPLGPSHVPDALVAAAALV
jgi:UDP-N-acetyl-alpha-D-muramoyl-L-alanyl-L-glutamate epimerase